jgi:TM2 domain-containing membrane protein YozV
MATRHPRLVAGALATAACLVFAGAATIVKLLELPLMTLAAPWALGLSLAASALFVGPHARKRLGTGGIDAETERRILEVAMASRGRVTTTAVAHALSLPLVEADRALTALSRAGYLAVETHPASGVIVYVFPEIDAGLVPPLPAPSDAAGPALQVAPSQGTFPGLVRVSHKRRATAALAAIFGGCLGLHKFYLGEPLAGLLYMVTFWTFLPAIAGIIEGIGYLVMSEHAFDVKHNARLV